MIEDLIKAWQEAGERAMRLDLEHDLHDLLDGRVYAMLDGRFLVPVDDRWGSVKVMQAYRPDPDADRPQEPPEDRIPRRDLGYANYPIEP